MAADALGLLVTSVRAVSTAVRAAGVARKFWVPLLLLLILAGLTSFGLNGSSAAAVRGELGSTISADPHLLAGSPLGVRADEWAINTPLSVMQVQTGMPRIQPLLGSGADMALSYDVPVADGWAVFRPQHWGFLALPLAQGFAFHWWFPAALLIFALWLLTVTLMPGRNALGLLLGAAAAFSPFLQWWNLAGSFLPEALAVLASALFIRILHAPSRWWLVTHAVALVWVLVTFALVLYPPFQIPCALVAAAFCLGYLVSATTDVGWRALKGRLGIVSACAAMSVACVLLFLVDHRSAVAAIAGSAYPGNRTVGSGGYSLTRLFSGFLDRTLTSRAAAKSIDFNQSEASSPLLAGVLAAPVAVWLIVADLRRRRRRRCSSVLVALLAVLAVFMVRLFAPHMDVLSQLTMLDRVPSNRLLLGMGMLSDVVLVTVAWQVSTSRPLRPPLLTTAFVLPFLALSALAVYLHRQHDVFVGPLAVAVALAAVVASAVALWATRRPELGAALLIVVSLFIAGMVNPLSAGVSTTGELPLGTAVAQLDRSDPGGWIMQQNRLGMAALVEQNVHTYSLVYNYPQTALWRELDPTGAQSDSYNRYGFANFQLRRGRTQFPGYNLDSYRIAVDGCSTFVQRHVKHIVAERPVDTGCLRLRRTVSEGTAVFYLYDVISPNADLPAARSFGLVPHRSSRCNRAANPPRPMLLGPVGMAPSAGAAPQCLAGRVRPGT